MTCEEFDFLNGLEANMGHFEKLNKRLSLIVIRTAALLVMPVTSMAGHLSGAAVPKQAIFLCISILWKQVLISRLVVLD